MTFEVYAFVSSSGTAGKSIDRYLDRDKKNSPVELKRFKTSFSQRLIKLKLLINWYFLILKKEDITLNETGNSHLVLGSNCFPSIGI